MSSDKTAIGNRMKRYEKSSTLYLPRRIPVIIRLDGRAFHTLTRRLYGRKYSEAFITDMARVAINVMGEMQGCDFCYGQSDEISFLLTDYRTIRTEAWFDYNINKMLSISASIASAYLSSILGEIVTFDSRAFSLPQDDVCNYYVWRQRDCTRNAILFAGYEHFSHNEMMCKNTNQIQEMLYSREGINFNDFPTIRKRGYCIVKGELDSEIPIFSQNREYVEQFVEVRED